ncbi:hypothetical protein COLO4_08881 [Corchorus olitorius]|uniref:Reverse transcriptase n=1 Tax=Corchorus olitorius TaxID=93759 RepID=A0A1R3KE90_9ROSI|nr:hypothetical protein COLO4_08881 [Corchorus olitorius]
MDKRVWPKEKSGIYSVKSGYASKKWDLWQGLLDRASSSHQVDRRLWKEIWHIKAPSKVKVFTWRLRRRALATNEELWKRKCIAEPVCVLCGEDVETIEHMLLLCSWTRKESARISREPEVLKNHIAFTSWIVWKARCQAVFEHKAINVDQRGCYVGKPPSGWHKVNCDGALCTVSLSAGIGVIRNHEGHLISGAGKKVVGESALCVEALAFKEGMKIAKSLQLDKIIVETDCEILYKSFVNHGKGLDWRIEPVLADINHLVKWFKVVEYRCVKREANMAADWIVVQSRLRMSFADLGRYQPSSLVKILDKDGLPAPHFPS